MEGEIETKFAVSAPHYVSQTFWVLRLKSSVRTDLLRRTLEGEYRALLGRESQLTQTGSVCLLALPAIPAITAVAPISSAPAAVPAPPPSSSSAPAAKTATTAAALCLRTRFVDHQVSPAEILAVQGIDCPVRILVAGDFDESETARLSREAVTNEVDTRRGNTHLRKPLLKLIFRSRKRKITDVELLHLLLLLPGT